MWQIKLKIMMWIGLLSVSLGAMLRLGVESRGLAYEREWHYFVREASVWMIGFGLFTLALTLNRWVAGDPNHDRSGSKPPPAS